jgi:tetratricopeptide (TPR) repeat protein
MLTPGAIHSVLRLQLYRACLVIATVFLAAASLGGLLYEVVTEHSPPPPNETYYRRVEGLLRAGSHESAIEQYRLGIHIRPDLDEGFLGLADVLDREQVAGGSPAERIEVYRRLLAIHPRHKTAHARLAEIFERLGRPHDALEHYRALLEAEPENESVLRNLGIALLKTGHPGAAEAALLRSIELDPNDPKSHNALGVAWIEQGRPDEAAAAFATALTLESENAGYRRNLEAALRVQDTARREGGPGAGEMRS